MFRTYLHFLYTLCDSLRCSTRPRRSGSRLHWGWGRRHFLLFRFLLGPPWLEEIRYLVQWFRVLLGIWCWVRRYQRRTCLVSTGLVSAATFCRSNFTRPWWVLHTFQRPFRPLSVPSWWLLGLARFLVSKGCPRTGLGSGFCPYLAIH